MRNWTLLGSIGSARGREVYCGETRNISEWEEAVVRQLSCQTWTWSLQDQTIAIMGWLMEKWNLLELMRETLKNVVEEMKLLKKLFSRVASCFSSARMDFVPFSSRWSSKRLQTRWKTRSLGGSRGLHPHRAFCFALLSFALPGYYFTRLELVTSCRHLKLDSGQCPILDAQERSKRIGHHNSSFPKLNFFMTRRDDSNRFNLEIKLQVKTRRRRCRSEFESALMTKRTLLSHTFAFFVLRRLLMLCVWIPESFPHQGGLVQAFTDRMNGSQFRLLR